MDSKNNYVPAMHSLKSLLAPFAHADNKKAIWQLINTIVPYLLLWVFMLWSLKFSYWLTLAIALIAGLFLVRIFILFHDCGHNSLFSSLKANRITGFFLGLIVFTPSEHWWRSHAIHHATSGNLDKRGIGDVLTLTVDEYQRKNWIGRLGYRLFRHPLVMFLLGPPFMFLIKNRIPVSKLGKREVRFQWWHNIALVVVIAVISILIGFKNFILIQLPVIWIGGLFGIWLFFVQHQYEGVYWERSTNWDYVSSALLGASYYALPKVFQWFSGNIGFHHIHHLNPKIPNYYLEDCYQSSPLFQESVKTIGLFEGLRSIGLDLIHESSKRLMRFQEI